MDKFERFSCLYVFFLLFQVQLNLSSYHFSSATCVFKHQLKICISMGSISSPPFPFSWAY
ncbi:hypothetical protein ACE6H2_006151 [Prunus campanulata]